MIIGVPLFLLANAGVFLAAAVLGERVQKTLLMDYLGVSLIRILLISATVLLCGLGGILTPAGLAVPWIAVLIGLGGTGHFRSLKRFRLQGVRPWMAALLCFLLLRLVLQSWFLAPYGLDVLSYHLPKVAEWIRGATFGRELGVDSHATFPAGFELIEAWWTVFFHHDVLIEMAGVEFLVLAFAAVRAIAELLGQSPRWASVAALFYILRPGVQIIATSCLNDLPVASLILATFALVLGRAPIGLLAMTAGLGLGIKPVYGYALPGLAFLLWALRRTPRADAGSELLSRGAGIVGLLVGAFWYARNAWDYGNPLHPITSQGLIDWSGTKWIQAGPSLGSLRASLYDLFQSRVYDPGPYKSHLTGITGWGALIFGCGLLALPVWLRSNDRVRRLAVAFALSALSVLLFCTHDDWNMRFILFFAALPCLAVADLLRELPGARPVAGAALALDLLLTFSPADLGRNDLAALARQSWRERSTAALVDVLAPEGPVAYFMDDRGPAYLLYGPDFSRRVVYLRVSSAEALIEAMDREQLPTLYSMPASRERTAILLDGVRSGRLVPRGSGFYARPY